MAVILHFLIARLFVFVILVAVTHITLVVFFLLLWTLLLFLIPFLRGLEVIPAAGQSKVWVRSRLRAVVAPHASLVALLLPRRVCLLKILREILGYPRRDPDASGELRGIDRALAAVLHGAELVVRV